MNFLFPKVTLFHNNLYIYKNNNNFLIFFLYIGSILSPLFLNVEVFCSDTDSLLSSEEEVFPDIQILQEPDIDFLDYYIKNCHMNLSGADLCIFNDLKYNLDIYNQNSLFPTSFFFEDLEDYVAEKLPPIFNENSLEILKGVVSKLGINIDIISEEYIDLYNLIIKPFLLDLDKIKQTSLLKTVIAKELDSFTNLSHDSLETVELLEKRISSNNVVIHENCNIQEQLIFYKKRLLNIDNNIEHNVLDHDLTIKFNKIENNQIISVERTISRM
jgi:hypothetical protein